MSTGLDLPRFRISGLGLKRSAGSSSLLNFLARVKKVPRTWPLSCFLVAVKKVPRTFLILYKVTQWFASAWVAEFAEGFGFDLTDPFTGHVEDFTNIFQGPHFSIIQTET